MLACAERLVSEYVDGDLAPAVARELEQHLITCGNCRAVLYDYCVLVAITRSLTLTTPHERADRPSHMAEISHRREILGRGRSSDLPA